jgi:acetyl-CoA carboxylase biotin carboxyl carrier protein
VAVAAAASHLVEEDSADDVTKFFKKSNDKKKAPASESTRLDEFYKLMEEEDLRELEVSEGSSHIKLVRQSKHQPVFHAPLPHAIASASVTPAAPVAPAQEGIPVNAPLAGVFYRSPSPTSPSFVKEGDTVSVGKALCIIEAMKVMNEVTSPESGRVIKILVENGKSVEANQPMFLLAPLD